jgi:hypothetical protein
VVVEENALGDLPERPRVRRENQNGVGSRLSGRAGVRRGLEARFRVHAGGHEHAGTDRFPDHGDDTPLLGRGQDEVLAGMTVHEKPRDAGRGRDRRDVQGEGLLVDGVVRLQRADRGRVDAGEALGGGQAGRTSRVGVAGARSRSMGKGAGRARARGCARRGASRCRGRWCSRNGRCRRHRRPGNPGSGPAIGSASAVSASRPAQARARRPFARPGSRGRRAGRCRRGFRARSRPRRARGRLVPASHPRSRPCRGRTA